MNDEGQQESTPERSGNPLPWFWVGTGLGILFSMATVVFVAELTRKRYRAPGAGFDQDEVDLVEDLTHAVAEGIQLLADAVDSMGEGFSDAARERIHYGLDPGQAGGGASAWYTGEEDE